MDNRSNLFESPFPENFASVSADLIPAVFELDEGDFPGGDQNGGDTAFRNLSRIEDQFASGPPELVALDDFDPIIPDLDPHVSIVPIQQDSWSTFGQGMSLGEFARNDVKTTFFTLDDDFLAFWKPRNVLFIGAGLGLGIGLRQSVDEDTRGYISRHPRRWSSFTESLGIVGNTEYQIAAIVALYGFSFRTENAELMEFTQLLIRTYTLTGLSTVTVKAIANTDRPSAQWMNGQFGFPSAHSSTSFAIAATTEEYYGPRAGIPAYILAGLISWSRVDEQDHDVSDVVFGAFLGYAIAKSIAGHHLRGDSRIQFFPWTDPNRGTYGAMIEVDF
jgi:membrane-associated phospholipid phosphatase